MPSIGSYLFIPHQDELLVWSILGLLRNSFDVMTFFSFKFNLEKVWQSDLSDSVFSLPLQHLCKIFMTVILLLQTFTVHAYIAAYVIMIYPIIYDEQPALLLPWLVVSAVKGLLSELLGLATGLGVCVAYGGLPRPCVIFVLERILVLIPNIYMWMLVFNFYLALSTSMHTRLQLQKMGEEEACEVLEMAARRRRTRFILNEGSTSVTANAVKVDQLEQTPGRTSISPVPSRLGSGTFGVPELISRLSRDQTTSSAGTTEDEQENLMFAQLGLELHPRLEGDRVLDQLIILVQRAAVLAQHPDLQALMTSTSVSYSTFTTNTPLTQSWLLIDQPFQRQSSLLRNIITRGHASENAFNIIVASELASGNFMPHVTSTVHPTAPSPRYISEFPNIFRRRRTLSQYSRMNLVPTGLCEQDQSSDQNVMTSSLVVASTSAGSFNFADVTDNCTQVSTTSKKKRRRNSKFSIQDASSDEELLVTVSKYTRSNRTKDNSSSNSTDNESIELGQNDDDDDEEKSIKRSKKNFYD